MSLEYIYLFQKQLYELLQKQELPKVYLSIQQDAKYPFILLNLQKVLDISEYHLLTYDVDFEICIFARDKAQENLLKMAHIIEQTLSTATLTHELFNALSIKSQATEWVRGHDLLTTKLILQYKILLQKKNA